MPLPKVKIRKPRRPRKADLPAPQRPQTAREEQEVFSGQVNGVEASMPEERLANELRKQGIPFEFRRTIGAPRGLPGWKELDFLVSKFGLLYAIEVDTAFTHRDKGRSDVLHDAIVLQDLEKQGANVHPRVIHLDGESDLADKKWTEKTVKRLFV